MLRQAIGREVGTTLPIGNYVGRITGASHTQAKINENWATPTPQIEFVFENEEGRIKMWTNLRGYMNATDLNNVLPKAKVGESFSFRSFDESSEKFLVRTFKGVSDRVEDPAKTENLLKTLDNILLNAGCIEENAEYDTDDVPEMVQDMEIGFRVVENERGKNEVAYTMPASKVSASSEFAS